MCGGEAPWANYSQPTPYTAEMVCRVNASFWYSITATCPKPEHSAPSDTLAHNTHPVKSPLRCDKTTTPNGPFATKVYLLYGFWVDGLLE
jgi:hypothetical protein